MSLWPRTLKQKTILVVVLVALLALGNVVTLQAMLRRFDDIGATVRTWLEKCACSASALR